MKKSLLLLILIMLATTIAACSGSNNGGNTTTNSTKTPEATQEGNQTGNESNESAYKDKYDPPVTISTVWGIDPELKFKNNETIENNVATKWALDTLGIEIKSLWSVTDSNNAFQTKMRLSLNSGNDIPDVVTIGDAQLAHELIDSGLFREVGSLLMNMQTTLGSKRWHSMTMYGTHIHVTVNVWEYPY